jgi:hypothetical protein
MVEVTDSGMPLIEGLINKNNLNKEIFIFQTTSKHKTWQSQNKKML